MFLKTRKVFFNKQIKETLAHYLKKTGIFDLDRYLFTNEKSKENKTITRVRVYQLINKWCKDVGISFKVGGHTLSKSFGYHLRMQGVCKPPARGFLWLFTVSASL